MNVQLTSLFLSFFTQIMKVSAILFVLSSSVTFAYSLSLPSISDCPTLPKRPLSTSVLDLRADDIKVIVALGDRYTWIF